MPLIRSPRAIERTELVTWTPTYDGALRNHDYTIGGGKAYDLTRTGVIWGQHHHQVSGWGADPWVALMAGAYVLNGTTLRITGIAQAWYGGTPVSGMKCQIIEYTPGVIKQIQNIITPGQTGGTVTINPVNLTKTVFLPAWFSGYMIHSSGVFLGTITNTSVQFVQPYGYLACNQYRACVVEFN